MVPVLMWWVKGNARGETYDSPAIKLVRPLKRACLLNAAQLEEYQRLVAWFLAWSPPSEPFSLGAIEIVDPALNYRYYLARIREDCGGQVQVGVFSHLGKLKALFGGLTT